MGDWQGKIFSERGQPRRPIGYYFTVLTGEMNADGPTWPILRRVEGPADAEGEARRELAAGAEPGGAMLGLLTVYDDGSVEHEEYCPDDLECDPPEGGGDYVPAEAHSDDRVLSVAFNAAPWLARASDAEVLALAGCGWGCDYPADEVAYASSEWEPELKRLFAYIERLANLTPHKELCGFECSVDEEGAMEWLEKRRPELAGRIRDGAGGGD